MHKKHSFDFDVFDSLDELSADDFILLNKARSATKQAYAPYSQFHVAAAGKLNNGEIITGTNQENASYPAGICAERTLLSAVSALFPAATIQAIAISYTNSKGESNKPIFPCGICRQSLLEYQIRMRAPIRLILGGQTGKNLYNTQRRFAAAI